MALRVRNAFRYTLFIKGASFCQSLAEPWIIQRESIQIYLNPSLWVAKIASRKFVARDDSRMPCLNWSLLCSSNIGKGVRPQQWLNAR